MNHISIVWGIVAIAIYLLTIVTVFTGKPEDAQLVLITAMLATILMRLYGEDGRKNG